MTQTALVDIKNASTIGIGLSILETGRARSIPPSTIAKPKLNSKKRFEFIKKSQDVKQIQITAVSQIVDGPVSILMIHDKGEEKEKKNKKKGTAKKGTDLFSLCTINPSLTHLILPRSYLTKF